jgi:hypothetical protein
MRHPYSKGGFIVPHLGWFNRIISWVGFRLGIGTLSKILHKAALITGLTGVFGIPFIPAPWWILTPIWVIALILAEVAIS